MTIKTSTDLVRYIRNHIAGSEFQDVKAVEEFTKKKIDEALASKKSRMERAFEAVVSEVETSLECRLSGETWQLIREAQE